jgi:V/A-type H+-transporting ATPase subunit A
MAGWWREKMRRLRCVHAMASQRRAPAQIVKLVGPMPCRTERLILETARLLREGYLQQNAMDPVDAYSSVEKQIQMLDLILHFHERGLRVVKRRAPISVIHNLPVVDTLIRMKSAVPNEELEKLDEIRKQVDEQMSQLDSEYR